MKEITYLSGCTSLGFASSKLGHALIGTVDGGFAPFPLIIQRFKPKKGYRMIVNAFPGTIWTEKGINEYGLVNGNSGLPTVDFLPAGLSSHSLFRQALLSCKTTDEAMTFFKKYSHNAFGSVIILVDKGGILGCVEKTPTQTVCIPVMNKWVGSANTF